MQRHKDGLGSREYGICTVVLIERRKDDNLVSWIADGHHGAHHGLCAPAGDNDLSLRIDGNAHKLRLFFSQSFAKILSTPGYGILMRSIHGHIF